MSKQKTSAESSAAAHPRESSGSTSGKSAKRLQRDKLPSPKELVGMVLSLPLSWWHPQEPGGELLPGGRQSVPAVCLWCSSSSEQAVLLRGRLAREDRGPIVAQVRVSAPLQSDLQYPLAFYLVPYWYPLLRLQTLALRGSLGRLDDRLVRDLRRRLQAALPEA